jgi:hypothetical protein
MKKLVLIDEEVLVRLVEGKYVEGSLHRDQWTGVIIFKAWVRKCPKHPKDRVICQLENGWLKESPTRIKFFNSVKKSLGLVQVGEVMERELEKATLAMVREKMAEYREKTIEEIMDEV